MRMKRRRTRLGGLSGLVIAGLCGGCASDASNGEIVDRNITIAPLDESLELMTSRASPGALSDNGLEVRAWVIPDDSAVIGQAMTDLGEPAPIDANVLGALEQNGMRLYRMPLLSLPALQDVVGPATHDRQESFGQVFDWRELFTRPLNGVTRGVAIDGRVRPLPGGAVSLLIRAWTMKTEEGPRVHFEMSPYYVASNASLRQILSANAGPSMLAERPEPGEVFRSMVLRTDLENGFAYMLTCESPEVNWADPRSRARATRENDSAHVSSGDGSMRGTIGPADFGPASSGPSTLGELLMDGEEGSGVRLIIVLIPHVPAALFPPEIPQPGSGQAAPTDD
jgi:hypothetical protein